MPDYHDVHVTTAEIPRTSIFDLPFGYELTCNRVAGWRLWYSDGTELGDILLGGEYHDKGLVVDVADHVILDSLNHKE